MREIFHNFVVVLPWLLAIVILEQLSFVCAKNYAGGKSWCFLVMAGVVYAAVGIVFALALKAHDNLGMMNLMWNIISTIFAFALGIIIFKEQNLGARKIIALVLGVFVLILAV
ncbi:small membrane protein [Cannes 8 virus]|uniref:Small membrane protein n=1 Tax=Marseillevirus marseillevirus TaxID=694581 RepID=D2XAC9_GBMV|nr:small membrane protein [Marseillevirus marseillevirus]YP_009094607.1 putative small membrane protein [Melbournevirus]ADB03906.1 small membrane protein [Marseillevirus marseillevirus]AGV01473.1 small membrane protein [Cannes 8 virus]AIT54719.1 membrane protein [Melbournevirus]